MVGAGRVRGRSAMVPARGPRLSLLLLSCVCLVSSCGERLSPGARSWWSHVRYLADDRLEGRNTGSRGYAQAAEYVARRFRDAGALPGGTDGFFQPVAFISRTIHEEQSGLWLVQGDSVAALRLGEDANLGMPMDAADSVTAPAVFVGYGLDIPELHYDDLAGLDLRGKIAVCLQGGPNSIPGPLRSHAQSNGERWKHLREAGAIGIAAIANPKSMDVPWERATLARLEPSMTLADSSLNETAGMRLSLRVNPARAERLFTGSGHRFSDMLALADSGVALPRFPLGLTIRARLAYARSPIESQNVVGVVPGSDPRLKKEYVVLSAHLDHLGIGGAIKGDSIYNGAMDNASGVATLIEVARLARQSGSKLRRSLILLAVTGEEKGLQGSRYFVAHPTVSREDIVADLNMDMFLPLVPFRYLIPFGKDESDLGDVLEPVASKFGVEIQDDPEPNRNRFIRSDQYNFIRRGIPSLAFKFGCAKGSPEERIFRDWTRERYHAPSDDLNQPVDKEAAAEFTRMLLQLCTAVANQDQRPRWKSGSFFRRFSERS